MSNFFKNYLAMKKETFLRMMDEIGDLRRIKMICVFDITSIPTIGIDEIRRGRDWNETSVGYVTDLKQFKNDFKNLGQDDLFVFGRLPECDNQIGLSSVKDCFKKNGNTEDNAEYYYLRNCTTISRIHCFVKKMENNKFGLFDCSTAGTSIVF